MRPVRCRASSALSLVAAVAFLFGVAEVQAAEFRHLDGMHRVGKMEARVTEPAQLFRRQGSDVEACGSSMLLCPSSVGGGCCPEGYECASESCYATTRGPATCGDRVGWYACSAVYGGGCCPDGYMCQRDDVCAPPSGEAYTQSCPTSYFLCPESMNYGCCPNGMECAVNQCYSTEPVTRTSELVITTTEDGDEVVLTTETIEVSTPDAPSAAPDYADENVDQDIFKYFPSVLAKVSQTSFPDEEDSDDEGGGGGLSTGALVGIVCGAVAFLVLVAVGAFIIIRHLNKVVKVVSESKQSDTSRSRPHMRQFKPTDSEIDVLSVDPLMMSPNPSNARLLKRPDVSIHSYGVTPSPDIIDNTRSVNDHTPNSFSNAYNSRNTSMDTGGVSYFDTVPGAVPAGAKPGRTSQQTATTTWRVSADSQGTYGHLRQWSNASETSDDAANAVAAVVPTYQQQGSPRPTAELEARTIVPELPGSVPGSPTFVVSPIEEHRRQSGASSIASVVTGGAPRVPMASHQRKRSGTGGGSGGRGGTGGIDGMMGLGVVSEEEIHGYYGPPDRMNGQTDNRPSTAGSRGPPS